MAKIKLIKRTERGWAGHFCCADRCQFRRNTLLECGDIHIIVSTVGAVKNLDERGGYTTVGYDRVYETMVFHAKWDGTYWDAAVSNQIYDFESDWSIEPATKEHIVGDDLIAYDMDEQANRMHEAVVTEISSRLIAGEEFPKELNDGQD